MTALPIASIPFFSWFQKPALSVAPQVSTIDDDLRREFVSRLISADGCAGEYGVQALMGLFPKDF
tara:strand:+ start:25972 stop:26166 length:195 start_codon:yes stop_codon:yes gene_type:complete